MSWDDFRDLVEKANSYRNRVKPERLKKDMGAYSVGTSTGSRRAQDGSPYKNVKVSFKGKGFNDISAPALEEYDAPEESFAPQNELQPDMWKHDRLSHEVHARLVEIAEDFVEGLDIGKDVVVEDLWLTGSLANFNWSKYSDIDLHVLVDFSKIDTNAELVKAFFDQARLRWNDVHRILVRGFEVEIYVQDINERHHSSGVYSLLKNGWVTAEPSTIDVDFDYDTALKKARDYKSQIECVESEIIGKEKDYELALRHIERIKEKIRNMRKVGLESTESEYSPENVAFKILRRNGTLAKISKLKTTVYDQSMSLKEE